MRLEFPFTVLITEGHHQYDITGFLMRGIPAWFTVACPRGIGMIKDTCSEALSARLRSLTEELLALDRELKSDQPPDVSSLQEFREALDNVRMTAWTVGELLNARETKRDPGTVLSFLTSERLRRFGQLVKDLNADIEHQGINWQTHGVQGVLQHVNLLQGRLGKLIDTQRTHNEASSTGR
jgi:hypothetical protein